MTTYTLSPTAYTLPLLHAAAHPSSTVSGLLVGTVTPTAITATSAIPLTHRYTSLAPTAELGIELVRASAAAEGKTIVGYYIAREGGETDLGRVGDKVLAALRTETPALGLVLDNERLKAGAPAYNVGGCGCADDRRTHPSRRTLSRSLRRVLSRGRCAW